MNDHHHFEATLATGSAIPTLLCGHCQSTLSHSRIFRNDGDHGSPSDCFTIGLCSADDCGAVNCCDQALSLVDNPEKLLEIAS